MPKRLHNKALKRDRKVNRNKVSGQVYIVATLLTQILRGNRISYHSGPEDTSHKCQWHGGEGLKEKKRKKVKESTMWLELL